METNAKPYAGQAAVQYAAALPDLQDGTCDHRLALHSAVWSMP